VEFFIVSNMLTAFPILASALLVIVPIFQRQASLGMAAGAIKS
jgi:hypothetical protein